MFSRVCVCVTDEGGGQAWSSPVGPGPDRGPGPILSSPQQLRAAGCRAHDPDAAALLLLRHDPQP